MFGHAHGLPTEPITFITKPNNKCLLDGLYFNMRGQWKVNYLLVMMLYQIIRLAFNKSTLTALIILLTLYFIIHSKSEKPSFSKT